jgi:hypothetical protein
MGTLKRRRAQVNETQAIDCLKAAVEKVGSQDKFGALHGMTGSLVGMIIRRERSLSKPVLDAIGLECVESRVYRRKAKGASS